MFWLLGKFIRSRENFFNLTTILAVLGMTIGVASLVVAMAVVSGYEFTLRRSIVDVTGHIIVVKRGPSNEPEKILKRIKPLVDGLKATTPFVVADAALVHQENLNGVVLQGMDPESFSQVLRLKSRIQKGKLDLTKDKNGLTGAVIGKGIAQKMNLQLGDTFSLVMPVSEKYSSERFRPRLTKMRVSGVINIGRHEYDHRYIITSLSKVQEFAQLGSRITGFRLRTKNAEVALSSAEKLKKELGYPFWVRSWKDVNHNIFEAYKVEKMILFFVLLVMVVAACFNVASTLFISVFRRYADVSILKAMGAPQSLLMGLFSFQGLFIGAMGATLGLLLGYLVCWAFLFAQSEFGLVMGEVYKIDFIEVDYRFGDIFAIVLASMFLCFISTLVPAWRGSRLKPTEGLRYE